MLETFGPLGTVNARRQEARSLLEPVASDLSTTGMLIMRRGTGKR